ncbi:DUF4440 domain-containing protein [Labrenzia sp. DG1229]|uniref:DUF4440 domain-containing protein n=1 Tax=Labrenzia sp. DG1229 TaxID=681847 RepID=UPI00048AA95D|nr:DUF4440 domain-containing protein [Labrenzia sp. DG1229]
MNSHIDDAEMVKTVLTKINNSWTQKNIEDLYDCFHGEMIIEGPSLLERKEGIEKCIEHHRETSQHIHCVKWNEYEHEIRVWNDSAMAKYRFEIQFESDGNNRSETGFELYAFSRESGTWKAVWNFIVPFGQAT